MSGAANAQGKWEREVGESQRERGGNFADKIYVVRAAGTSMGWGPMGAPGSRLAWGDMCEHSGGRTEL